jgi:hypothetical protein
VGKFIKEEKLGVVMYRGDNLTFLEILLGEIMRWEVCEFWQGKRSDLVRLSAIKGEKTSENISKKERFLVAQEAPAAAEVAIDPSLKGSRSAYARTRLAWLRTLSQALLGELPL